MNYLITLHKTPSSFLFWKETKTPLRIVFEFAKPYLMNFAQISTYLFYIFYLVNFVFLNQVLLILLYLLNSSRVQ